jgi:glucose/arabinose dehydrogenase/mono/diheme cytochrome c family protein
MHFSIDTGKVYPILLLLLFSFCQPNEDLKKDYPVVGYIQLENSKLEIAEISTDLEVPWDLEVVEEDVLWFTQVSGSVHVLDLKTGHQKKVFQVPDVLAKKSYGLLGMAVHPKKNDVYLHYTYAKEDGLEEKIFSRLVQYSFDGEQLTPTNILLDDLPGATYHNGSRIVISEDEKIYFSLGDVGRTDLVLDDTFPGGKIHRLNLDGSIPEDNPIPGSTVWAKGLRNTQGLTFGRKGNLYGSDHGPITDDEVNLLVRGGNYGWPEIHGFVDQEKEQTYAANHYTIEPLLAWTPTIATAGIAFYDSDLIPEWKNTLLLATMKGRSLRVLHLNEAGDQIQSEGIFLQKHFGRLRDISVSHDGAVYISTTNKDWHPRFQPWMYDELPDGPDRILRIRKMDAKDSPIKNLPTFEKEAKQIALMDENWNFEVAQEWNNGAKIYSTHCLVCHGPEGEGSNDLIPPLSNTQWVTGDKGKLIRLVLAGMSGPIEVNGQQYNQEMPAFSFLSDEEVAEVLTFIRNHFGNSANAVIAGEVFEERKGL